MTDPAPGQRIGDRYDVLDRIGAGAFATTWRARDSRLQRIVALKVLRTDLAADANFAARFAREAQTAAAISSDHTVQIFDVGQAGDLAWIAMEYIDGTSLREVLKGSGGALKSDRARDLIHQVLRGLGAIHAGGVIHRDLKPENVLIGSDGIARIADFGIATVMDQVGLTTTGTTFGTAAYMAPEQGRGEPVSPATDLYATGVMLFEMLTGRLPFPASTVVAMLLAHQNQPPPSLVSVNPALRQETVLDAVINQAMQKQPSRRFQSARSMAAALESPVEAVRTARTVQSPQVEQTMPIQVPPRIPPTSTVPYVKSAPLPERRRRGVPIGRILGLIVFIAIVALGTRYMAQADWLGGSNPPAATETVTDEPVVQGDPTDDTVVIDEPTIEPVATDFPTERPTAIDITDDPTATAIELPTETPVPDDNQIEQVTPGEGEPTESVLIDPMSSPDQ